MKHRREDREDGEVREFAAELGEVRADDAYLDALSRGQAPAGDELGAMLLAWREEIHAPIPVAPKLPAHRRHRPGVWAGGLLGAAAATLVIIGGGSVLYGADADSPLYGLSTRVFGERAAMVELAGTLEEMDAKAANGDTDGVLGLVDQAQLILGGLSRRPAAPTEDPVVTVTRTATQTATATVVETVEVTTTIVSSPSSSSSAALTEAPASIEPTDSVVPTEPSPLPLEPELG